MECGQQPCEGCAGQEEHSLADASTSPASAAPEADIKPRVPVEGCNSACLTRQLHEQASSEILLSAPAADKQVTAKCISTIGQAFVGDEYIQRVFEIKPGNEPVLLEGMSRVYLNRFSNARLLYHTQDCRSAAIVYTSEQSDALDNKFSFSIVCSILPGLLHMLRALPLRSLPKLLSLIDRMNSEGTAAVKASGVTASYLKLIVIATHPEHQRRGLGTAVLHAITAEADRQQLPLYLEAIEGHLLPWYERHGFVHIGDCDVHPGDHSRVVQLMLRMPKPLST